MVMVTQYGLLAPLRCIGLLSELIALPKFDYKKYNMKEPCIEDFLLQTNRPPSAALNNEIGDYLKAGRVKAVPGISEFIENGVKLTDDQELEFDTVIMATG